MLTVRAHVRISPPTRVPVADSFSLAVLIVDGLVPIQFRDDAFDRIVLPSGRKELLRAIVEAGRRSAPGPDPGAGEGAAPEAAVESEALNSIVDGKGEGTLFLLFGPPGVGKTLTAEAMAESLHLPLYTVSMGELGTSADVLGAHNAIAARYFCSACVAAPQPLRASCSHCLGSLLPPLPPSLRPRPLARPPFLPHGAPLRSQKSAWERSSPSAPSGGPWF